MLLLLKLYSSCGEASISEPKQILDMFSCVDVISRFSNAIPCTWKVTWLVKTTIFDRFEFIYCFQSSFWIDSTSIFSLFQNYLSEMSMHFNLWALLSEIFAMGIGLKHNNIRPISFYSLIKKKINIWFNFLTMLPEKPKQKRTTTTTTTTMRSNSCCIFLIDTMPIFFIWLTLSFRSRTHFAQNSIVALLLSIPLQRSLSCITLIYYRWKCFIYISFDQVISG